MISKFSRNLFLVLFFVTITTYSFGRDCDYPSAEKILAMSNEEIIENYIQCMKDKDNNTDEKEYFLTEKLQFIEKDSTFDIILQKIMPFNIGASVFLCLASGCLFFSGTSPRGITRTISGGVTITFFLTSGALWKLNQYQNNRMMLLKESRKTIAAPDIAKIFENMKKNNNG